MPPSDDDGFYLGPEENLIGPGTQTRGGTHYRDLGRDTTEGLIVLIHGIGDFSFRYALLAPALVKLGYRVAVLDFIGRGWSPVSFFSPLKCDAESHSLEIKAVVDSIAFHGKHHIVGHSMGGCAATHYVAEYGTPQPFFAYVISTE